MLEVTRVGQIVRLHVVEPVALGPALERLATQLVDACAALDEDDDQPVAVLLTSGGSSYCVQPPRSASDCDAGAQAWAEATAAVANLGPPTIAALQGDAIGPGW